MAAEQIQGVVLTLEDGRKGTFFGKVLVDPSEHGKTRLVDVEFTRPTALPEDLAWAEIAIKALEVKPDRRRRAQASAGSEERK